jgi:hypothetical protein
LPLIYIALSIKRRAQRQARLALLAVLGSHFKIPICKTCHWYVLYSSVNQTRVFMSLHLARSAVSSRFQPARSATYLYSSVDQARGAALGKAGNDSALSLNLQIPISKTCHLFIALSIKRGVRMFYPISTDSAIRGLPYGLREA